MEIESSKYLSGSIRRIYDDEAGVICYILKDFRGSENAISCIKINEEEFKSRKAIRDIKK